MAFKLRGGHRSSDRRLDRLPSETTEHFEKYPLTVATLPSASTSMAIGINWYEDFDAPVQRTIRGRRYWVIGDGDLGPVRGGHSVCLRHWSVRDAAGWWEFYDQGVEGRCVEFATSRVMSHANRKRYDITSRWLYWNAQMTDEWEGGEYPGGSPSYGGTSVRAALDIAQKKGMVRARPRGAPIHFDDARPDAREGIDRYRWVPEGKWDLVREALGVPDWLPGVPLNNSWGRSYPREVILLDEAGSRTLDEWGEYGIVTDR